MLALSLESKGTKNSVSIWSMVTSESAWAPRVLLSNGYKPESNTQTMQRLAFSHVSPIRDQRLRGLATVRLCFSLQKFMHLVALGIGFGERYLTNNQSNNNNSKLSSKQCSYCRFYSSLAVWVTIQLLGITQATARSPESFSESEFISYSIRLLKEVCGSAGGY